MDQNQNSLKKVLKFTTAVSENGKAVATTLSVEYGIKPITSLEDPLLMTKGSNMKFRISKAGGNGYSYNIDADELYSLNEAAKFCYNEVLNSKLHPEPLSEILCKQILMAKKSAIQMVMEEPVSKVRTTYNLLESNIADQRKAKFKAGNIEQQNALKIAVCLAHQNDMMGGVSMKNYLLNSSMNDIKAYGDACKPYGVVGTATDNNADTYFIYYCCCDAYSSGLVKLSWFDKDITGFGGSTVIKSEFKTPTQKVNEKDNKVHGTGITISFNLYESSPFRIEMYEKVGDPAKNGGVGLSNATMAPGKKPVSINLTCDDFLYMTGYMLDILRERNQNNYDTVVNYLNAGYLNNMMQNQAQTQMYAQPQMQYDPYTLIQSQNSQPANYSFESTMCY